ncbi:hypothetical protein ADJ73_15795 [Arsenicicoccus sp. oral taxon 190]|nr:hypothetical protein ADJ73_15795 [Arsenicicoccus sp. oral taxon 190]
MTSATLRVAVAGSLLALPVAGAVGALWRGWRGAAGASVGVLTTTVFFSLGILAVDALTRGPAAVVLPGAFVVYATQLGLLFLVYVLLRQTGLVEPMAFAGGAVAGVLVWQLCHTVAFLRARHEIYPGLGEGVRR